MTDRTLWHTEDFDLLSWHDVHIHGLRFASFNESDGTAELVLDIDYILEWVHEGNAFVFTVCAAELTFHDTFNLRLELDYKMCSAGMCPFMIYDIHREPLVFSTGYQSFRWSIPIHWPQGLIEFEAPAFTLQLVGTPAERVGQCLTSEQRVRSS
ncbi:hypothetical protein [Methylocucumis oryzae]|nr:hypothetical protein [Methylocucumis oryzae]